MRHQEINIHTYPSSLPIMLELCDIKYVGKFLRGRKVVYTLPEVNNDSNDSYCYNLCGAIG